MQRPRARLVTIGSVVAMTLLVSATAATAGPRVPRSAVRASSGPAVRIRPGARSFRIRRTDGNDVKGPLDLKALTITRGRSEDVLTFKTQAKVKNSQLDPTNGNFAIGIDTNDDQKYDYYEYFFYSEGRLRSLL